MFASDLPRRIVCNSRSCRFTRGFPQAIGIKGFGRSRGHRCFRVSARFVLATSSAKALSRNTTVDSPAGERASYPVRYADREGLHIITGDRVIEADNQRTGTNRMYGLVRDRFRLDGHTEIEAELHKQLVEYVLFGSAWLDMVKPGKQCVL